MCLQPYLNIFIYTEVFKMKIARNFIKHTLVCSRLVRIQNTHASMSVTRQSLPAGRRVTF